MYNKSRHELNNLSYNELPDIKIPVGLKPYYPKPDEQLYFLTKKYNLLQQEGILYPKIPDSTLAGEEIFTPRICVCNKIYRNLKAIPIGWAWNKTHNNFPQFYVYKAIDYQESYLYEPDMTLVPDACETHELWSLAPIKFKYIGQLQVTDTENLRYNKKIINNNNEKEIIQVDSRKNVKWEWIEKPIEKVRI